MPRYAKGRVRAGGWVEDDHYSDSGEFTPSLEVDSFEAVDTGLIWETGEPIMRVPNSIGFHADIE